MIFFIFDTYNSVDSYGLVNAITITYSIFTNFIFGRRIPLGNVFDGIQFKVDL